jgi:2-amino-4-hydroxy-6-hydroxymethyldihydropteridine diphosphokinase
MPRFTGPVVATTQATPLPHVHNFGGFTDGDRAAFAAQELGASCITLVGFDLDDENVDPLKRGKLHIARKLLALIGIRA